METLVTQKVSIVLRFLYGKENERAYKTKG
jgi:hypothetical protein